MQLSTDIARHSPSVAGQPADCDRCLDIGVRISPAGVFEPCPAIVLGQTHGELSPAALMINRSIHRGVAPDSHLFDVARTLAAYSTAAPCSRFELIDRHFSYISGPEAQRRKVSAAIEQLRDEWLLPVGSRKSKPAGYWIITEERDFEEWFERKKSQPIKELASLHRLARTYWPVFAEQLELEFTDLGADQGSAIVN
jgi:hypothetical protein